MRRPLQLLALLLSAWLLTACSDPAETDTPAAEAHSGDGGKQGQKFSDDRVWPGLELGKCGSHLNVVPVTGQGVEYFPPKEFFKGFESHDIDLGENPRPATDLTGMMAQYNADTVTLVPCTGPELALDQAQLAEQPGLAVLTGKGLIKLVRQQGGAYITVTREIQEIRFSSSEQAE
ncbi:MAG: hypothetical protein P1U78_12535 [Alcanivoracaceae bacterium]|nr:hypothetical protein [Alcanivoracaceae bacterium]